MDAASVVAELKTLADRRPEALERSDVVTVAEYLDPEETDAELVERAVRVVAAATRCNPQLGVSVVPELTPLLEADRPETRDATLAAMDRIVSTRPAALDPTVDRLLARLAEEPDPDRRARAGLVLARIAEDDPGRLAGNESALVETMEDESGAVRATATRAVAAVAGHSPGDVRAGVPVLVARLDAPVAGTRIDAARALSTLAEEAPDAVATDVSPVVDALDDDNPRVREEAMAAIANVAVAEPPAVADHDDRLLSRLGDARVGGSAVEALMGTAVTDPRGTAERLVAVIHAADEPARANAERTLRGIAMRNPAPVVEALSGELDDRTSATGRVGVRILAGVADHRPARIREAGSDVVAELGTRPASDDEAVRVDVCRILGATDDETALSTLRDRVEDESRAVRAAAAEAMTSLADRGVVTVTERDRDRIESVDSGGGDGPDG